MKQMHDINNPLRLHGIAAHSSLCCMFHMFLARDVRSIHVAINDGILKIFGWNRWKSIRELRNFLGYDGIYTMAVKRRRKFMTSMHLLHNPLLNSLKQYCDSF